MTNKQKPLAQKTKLTLKADGNKGQMGVLIVAVAGLQLITIFLIFLNLVNSVRVANKPTPSLAMLEDGTSVRLKTVDKYHREPEAIETFLRNIMSQVYTWNGKLPPENYDQIKVPLEDPGVTITNEKTNKRNKVATSTSEATYAFDPELREQFLQSLAEVFPQAVFEKDKQTILIIKDISQPRPIKGKKGEWRSNMVATMLAFNKGDPRGKAIPINREIYVRAVEPPQFSEDASATANKIAKYRQAGLEIYEMREFQIENLHAAPVK